MRRFSKQVLTHGFLALSLAACGASGGDGNGGGTGVDAGSGGPDANPSDFATLMGTVWVPGNAPGLVPAGHEIPVFDAIVYLSSQRPAPFAEGASCRPCTEAPSNAIRTGPDGNFVISNVVPGTYWMIIEKGDFRLEQEITINPSAVITLLPEQTTLPNVNDPANGKSMPHIALATGAFDDMEDILGKMSIGEVDGGGAFVGTSAAGAFDLYDNGGNHTDQAVGTLTDLVSSLDRMLEYDIIFIPCAGSAHTSALQDQAVLKNIRDYVAAGGKLYVTDWSGEWADNVFPGQVELDAGDDTPAGAYDPGSDTWNTAMFGGANGSPPYTSNGAVATEDNLSSWLDGQIGPLADGSEGAFSSSNLSIEDNWNRIVGLHPVEVGLDADGNVVIDSPKKYVVGPDEDSADQRPLTVTYEPAGCGRVLYSTYHTTHSTHVGLVPQERILVYLIMEIGICTDTVIID